MIAWWISVIVAALLGSYITIWVIVETGWHPETRVTHTRLAMPDEHWFIASPSLEEIAKLSQ